MFGRPKINFSFKVTFTPVFTFLEWSARSVPVNAKCESQSEKGSVLRIGQSNVSSRINKFLGGILNVLEVHFLNRLCESML